MLSFKEFLIEAKMTPKEAYSILGIDGDTTEQELKKIFRKLSIEHHPDQGGDINKMQQINLAYEVAKKSLGGGSTKSRSDIWDEIHEKTRQGLRRFLSDVDIKFKPDNYKRYFEEIFNKQFNYEIKTSPTSKEIDVKYPQSSAWLNVKFYDSNNDTVIKLDISADAHAIMNPTKTLGGSSDDSYQIFSSVEIFHDNKKVKLKQRDWNSTISHKIFYDPELIFEKKKMENIATGAKTKNARFTKKDALLFVKNKLQARPFNDDFVIDIYDDLGVYLQRDVMMRIPMWSIYGMMDTSKKHRVKLDQSNKFDRVYFDESEKKMLMLSDAIADFKKHKNLRKFEKDIKNLKIT